MSVRIAFRCSRIKFSTFSANPCLVKRLPTEAGGSLLTIPIVFTVSVVLDEFFQIKRFLVMTGKEHHVYLPEALVHQS